MSTAASRPRKHPPQWFVHTAWRRSSRAVPARRRPVINDLTVSGPRRFGGVGMSGWGPSAGGPRGSVLVGRHSMNVCAELVERHCPSGCSRRVGLNPGMGQQQLRAAANVLKFDANLSRDGMSLGHAHVGGRYQALTLASDIDSVDRARLAGDDLAVLAGEPRLPCRTPSASPPPAHQPPNWRPPTRTSIFATGMVAPSGPLPSAAKCSGSVHICQMRSTGASKLRSIVTAFWEALLSVIVITRLVAVGVG